MAIIFQMPRRDGLISANVLGAKYFCYFWSAEMSLALTSRRSVGRLLSGHSGHRRDNRLACYSTGLQLAELARRAWSPLLRRRKADAMSILLYSSRLLCRQDY